MMSKHAVLALAETLHLELAAKAAAIGVSVLCPEVVNTRIAQSDRNRPAHHKRGGPSHPERDLVEGALSSRPASASTPPRRRAHARGDPRRALLRAAARRRSVAHRLRRAPRRDPARAQSRLVIAISRARRGVKVGVLLIFQNYQGRGSDADMVRDQIRIADLAEPLGFDSLWPPEHHFTDYSACPDNVQFLSYMAAKTTRIQLGTGAVIVPWNDPLRVVEKIAFLDHLSDGRAVLGLGRGLSRVEYEHFGIEMAARATASTRRRA